MSALVLLNYKTTGEENVQQSVFISLTFLFGRDGEARHDVEALGAVHHQWAGAALRLGGAGRSTRTQAVRENTVNMQDFNKTRFHTCK